MDCALNISLPEFPVRTLRREKRGKKEIDPYLENFPLLFTGVLLLYVDWFSSSNRVADPDEDVYTGLVQLQLAIGWKERERKRRKKELNRDVKS